MSRLTMYLLVVTCACAALAACAAPPIAPDPRPAPAPRPLAPKIEREQDGARDVNPLFVPPLLWRSSCEIVAFLPEAPTRHSATLLLRKVSAVEVGGKEIAAVAMGSGTVVKIDGPEIYILTARHVVEGAERVMIERFGFAAEASIVKITTSPCDLALLCADSPILSQMFAAAPVAEEMPAPGSKLWTCGNALGAGLRITSGPYASPYDYVMGSAKFCRIACQVLPGNSGGGVWHDGALLGVVSMVAVNPRNGQYFSHMGLAVPVKAIRAFLEGTPVMPDAAEGG